VANGVMMPVMHSKKLLCNIMDHDDDDEKILIGKNSIVFYTDLT